MDTHLAHHTMPHIQPGPLPQDVLLKRYELDRAYTDCYHMDMPRAISFTEYVAAFYTTPLFKVERLLLAVFGRRPSTDLNAQELAAGQISQFAVWNVEARAHNQLLMSDYLGQTRSWFMLVPAPNGDPGMTRLYFGSAVMPQSKSASGEPKFSWAFRLLFGFHRLYTKALMRAVHGRLMRPAHHDH